MPDRRCVLIAHEPAYAREAIVRALLAIRERLNAPPVPWLGGEDAVAAGW